ncbi:uncharacterized protein LOC133180485 [Saccostrea echinata]|uniref:uncharacterized protein LOC133180485 n=1 Tax=Saccostrea echinata TaxID=191078 RepID=UPI002A836D36|nr:uncharacterized protein LOC133180485 [Saccostrea echinata]
MEAKQSYSDISSLLMDHLQKLRQVSGRSREDSEVERCFPEIRSPFKSTDGNLFKFPRDYRENMETNIRNYIPSPKSSKTSCALYGENSDWMMAEKTKSRTPPASPATPSSSNSAFRYSPSVTKQHRIENKVADRGPNVAGDDEIVYCVPRTIVTDLKSQKDCSTVEQTPTKQNYGSEVISPFRRSSPSPSHSEDLFRGRQSDTVDNGTFEERQSERVRKQLNFDACSLSKKSGTIDDLYYSSERSRSPCKRREVNEDEYEDHTTSRLVLQLLSQIKGQGRKRKASDCCSCDCDSESDRDSFKRQRNDYFSNQFRSENEFNWRRFTEQQEVLPDNCTCALMEKEFLKMAEHAYKNIRRQDGSSESFVRFQKELSETNTIINESLSVLKNMKNICEHRHINKY